MEVFQITLFKRTFYLGKNYLLFLEPDDFSLSNIAPPWSSTARFMTTGHWFSIKVVISNILCVITLSSIHVFISLDVLVLGLKNCGTHNHKKTKPKSQRERKTLKDERKNNHFRLYLIYNMYILYTRLSYALQKHFKTKLKDTRFLKKSLLRKSYSKNKLPSKKQNKAL